MKQNEGNTDRVIRIVVGLSLLIISTYYLSGLFQIIAAIVGLITLFTGFTGYCALYSIIGINTKHKSKGSVSKK